MNKKLFVSVAFILAAALGILLYAIVARPNQVQPIVFEADNLFLPMSIDEMIQQAELIVLGEVQSNLPVHWNGPNGSDPQNASPEQIAAADGLFTDSIIFIDETWKGDVPEAVVRVRAFIGETLNVRWVDAYEPAFMEKRAYLLFLVKDTGVTANVDPGHYVPVNAGLAVYEIVDGKAISRHDKWRLDELIAYIEKSLSQDPMP